MAKRGPRKRVLRPRQPEQQPEQPNKRRDDGIPGRQGEYLFLRKGSRNWTLRLQFTGELAVRFQRKKLEVSLGTPDKEVAKLRAAEAIANHKRLLRELAEKRNVMRAEEVQQRIRTLLSPKEHEAVLFLRSFFDQG
jgi:hypothetical protein